MLGASRASRYNSKRVPCSYRSNLWVQFQSDDTGNIQACDVRTAGNCEVFTKWCHLHNINSHYFKPIEYDPGAQVSGLL